jgi:hypothetical protein
MRPTECPRYLTVSKECKAGGQDWSSLVGRMFCAMCYKRYQRYGTFEKTKQRMNFFTVIPSAAGTEASQTESKCSYDGCISTCGKYCVVPPDCIAGKKDWSSLVGKVLCRTCYEHYRVHGSLDRQIQRIAFAAVGKSATGPGASETRSKCWYENCVQTSDVCYVVPAACKAGKRDWSRLAGKVLCRTCYKYYRKHGTLQRRHGEAHTRSDEDEEEISEWSEEELSESSEEEVAQPRGKAQARAREKVPAQARVKVPAQAREKVPAQAREKVPAKKQEKRNCRKRTEAAFTVEDGGGDSSSDSTSQDETPVPKLCSYEACPKPVGQVRYARVRRTYRAGGQDWSKLVGRVLCCACIRFYTGKGTLERTKIYQDRGPQTCEYPKCKDPAGCNVYHRIRSDCEAGGRDWSAWVGKTLCKKCYKQYALLGTFDQLSEEEKLVRTSTYLSEEEKRCSFEGCGNTAQNSSSQFVTVSATCTAGGRDWSSLVGKVLCTACFGYYCAKGTCTRVRDKQAASALLDLFNPSEIPAKRCSYEACSDPTKSSWFFQISSSQRSGGQDWTPLIGKMLCMACFSRYRDRGTLERVGSYKRKKPEADNARDDANADVNGKGSEDSKKSKK